MIVKATMRYAKNFKIYQNMYASHTTTKTNQACTMHTSTTHSGVTDVHPIGVESGLHLVGVVDVQQIRATKLAGLSNTAMVMMMMLTR